MSRIRSILLGPPYTYHVRIQCVLMQPLLAAPEEPLHLIALIEQLRSAFDIRMFAYSIEANGLHLVLRHRAVSESDEHLRARWASIGGRVTPMPRLRARFTSLGGFMQTLLQRFSRDYHRRHDSGGHLWASRYRACLLADDAALLASMVWIEDRSIQQTGVLASSHKMHSSSPRIALAPLPLRVGPDDSVFTADESPPGLSPPGEAQTQYCFERFAAILNPSDRHAYGLALENGWALGRPDSLSETLARLARPTGRGRSRKLRDLDDKLGLCGVWG